MKLKYIFKDLRRFLFIIHIRKKKVYNLHQKTKKKKKPDHKSRTAKALDKLLVFKSNRFYI